MNQRYSTPPSETTLAESTESLKRSNDALAAKVGHLPLPPPRLAGDITDEQRLAVCRELQEYWYKGQHISLDAAEREYVREIKARLGR